MAKGVDIFKHKPRIDSAPVAMGNTPPAYTPQNMPVPPVYNSGGWSYAASGYMGTGMMPVPPDNAQRRLDEVMANRLKMPEGGWPTLGLGEPEFGPYTPPPPEAMRDEYAVRLEARADALETRLNTETLSGWEVEALRYSIINMRQRLARRANANS